MQQKEKKSLWNNIRTLNKTNKTTIKKNNKLTEKRLKIREEIREIEEKKKRS